jgi:hypothetical protein
MGICTGSQHAKEHSTQLPLPHSYASTLLHFCAFNAAATLGHFQCFCTHVISTLLYFQYFYTFNTSILLYFYAPTLPHFLHFLYFYTLYTFYASILSMPSILSILLYVLSMDLKHSTLAPQTKYGCESFHTL